MRLPIAPNCWSSMWCAVAVHYVRHTVDCGEFDDGDFIAAEMACSAAAQPHARPLVIPSPFALQFPAPTLGFLPPERFWRPAFRPTFVLIAGRLIRILHARRSVAPAAVAAAPTIASCNNDQQQVATVVQAGRVGTDGLGRSSTNATQKRAPIAHRD